MKKTVVLLALASGLAHAEFRDGNRLLSEMNGNHGEKMYAMGYVSGVVDALSGVTVCGPSTATLGQMFDMVKQYLEQYPANRHNSADRIINHVLKSVWPCANRGSSL